MQSESHSRVKDVRDLERLTRLYAVLSRVNEAIIRTTDEQALFEAACRIAVEVGDFALAWIGFVDPETQRIRVAAKAGRDEEYLEQITISLDPALPEGQGPTATSLRECRLVVNNDTLNNTVMGPWRDEQLRHGFRSSASLPLQVFGRCIGVITLCASTAGYFDEEEVRLLTALADDFSFALQSAEVGEQREAALVELQRSRDELARRAERMALLKDLAETGASSLAVDETADRILDKLCDRLHPRIATILVIDDDGRHLVPLALRGFAVDYIEQHFGPVDVEGPGQSAAVFRSKQASYVPDSETDPTMSPQSRAFNRSLGVRAGVSAPLIARGETIGTISFAWEAPRAIDAEEVAFLESVASEAAIGLQNARLFEAERKSAAYADALNGINDAIHSTLEIDEIMRRVVQDAKDTMDTDVAVIELHEGDTWPVRYAAGTPATVLGRPLTPEQSLMSKTAAAKGKPLLVGDATADVDFREIAARHGITSFAGVPLIVRGITFGVLLLVDYGRKRHFGELEKDFVGKLGASVSLALENARLFEVAASARANRVLAEISELLASTSDAETAASEVLAKAGGLLGAVAAVLTQVDDGRLFVTSAWGRLEDLAGRHLGRDELPSHAEALESRRPVVVGDVLESSAANRRLASEREIRSLAIYPLVVHGEETGTLAFAFSEPTESFDEFETTTMARLAYTLSIALQNVELFRAQQQAATDAQALNRINDAIHSTLDFDEILNRVVVEANSAFGSESAAIVVKEGDAWIIRYATGFEGEVVGLAIPEEQRSFMEAVERANEPVIVENATKDPRLPAGWVRRFSFASFLAAPLVVRGEMLGVMFFNFHREPRPISAAKTDFARKLSPTVSLALGNSRLYEIERESVRLNEALNTIDQDIHSTLSTEEILARIVPAATAALGSESAAMGVREGDGWVVRYEYRLREGLVGRRFTDEELRIARRAVDEQDVQVVDDAFAHPEVNQETRRLFETRSLLVVPLIAREEAVGVLYFIYHSRIHRFSEAEADFARRLSVSLGLAIVNARLFEAERAARRKAREGLDVANQLLRATHALAEPIDLEHVLAILAQVIVDAAGHARSWVLLWDEAQRATILSASAGKDALPVGSVFPYDSVTPETKRAIDEKQTQLADFDALPPDQRGKTIQTGSHLALFVPMLRSGRLIGVIALDDPGERREFTEREVAVVQGISAQAAVVLENARLFEAEREIADRLQEALLTLPDTVSGIEFANAYHSASEAARVGGDFYDLFPIDREHVGVVIGDVAGKGLDAAVLTSMVKNTLRAHASEKGKTPKQIVTLTNDVVYGATPSESFVTVFFGILDCRDGRLVYSNAGHTTAAVVREDGSAGRLSVTGPLLGAFGDVEFDQAETCLDLDEMLFLYTDGLTEARRDGELYGEERLFGLLGSTRAVSAREVVQDVIQEVMAYTGGRLRDDMALLALKRVEPGAETPQQQKLEM